MPAVPTPPTIRDGVTPSSTWNQFRDAINFLLGPPIASLRQTAAQTLTTGVLTAVTFDVEDVDTDVAGLGGHSTSSNTSRWVAQYPGWYVVAAGVSWASNSTGQRVIDLLVNGTGANGSRIWVDATAGGSPTMLASRTVKLYLTAGDFVEVEAYQNSGGNLNTWVSNALEQSMMNVWWQSR